MMIDLYRIDLQYAGILGGMATEPYVDLELDELREMRPRLKEEEFTCLYRIHNGQMLIIARRDFPWTKAPVSATPGYQTVTQQGTSLCMEVEHPGRIVNWGRRWAD